MSEFIVVDIEQTPVVPIEVEVHNTGDIMEVDLHSTEQVFEVTVSTSNGDKNYVHEQRTPSDTWVIYHNLNKMPSVTVIDSAGTEVEGEVEHLNNRSVIIRFSGEFTGRATLN